jgi:hypothetical protein
MAEIGDPGRGHKRVELLAVRPVDSTELLHGVGHRAFAFRNGSAGEATAESCPSPTADALQVPVAAEHEGDAVPMREEQELQRGLTAGLGRHVGCGIDRADARLAHRRQRIGLCPLPFSARLISAIGRAAPAMARSVPTPAAR